MWTAPAAQVESEALRQGADFGQSLTPINSERVTHISAQAMRAILLASATTTSWRGFAASIRASHEPGAGGLRPLQRKTEAAPTIERVTYTVDK